jgi:hypothetical protein
MIRAKECYVSWEKQEIRKSEHKVRMKNALADYYRLRNQMEAEVAALMED